MEGSESNKWTGNKDIKLIEIFSMIFPILRLIINNIPTLRELFIFSIPSVFSI
jgi:hypothetical protein